MFGFVWADGNCYLGDFYAKEKKVKNALNLCDEGTNFELCHISAGGYVRAAELNELIEVQFDGQSLTSRALREEEQAILEASVKLMERARKMAMPQLVVSTFNRMQGKGNR